MIKVSYSMVWNHSTAHALRCFLTQHFRFFLVYSLSHLCIYGSNCGPFNITLCFLCALLQQSLVAAIAHIHATPTLYFVHPPSHHLQCLYTLWKHKVTAPSTTTLSPSVNYYVQIDQFQEPYQPQKELSFGANSSFSSV